jgi:hypothetical protein
MKNYIVFNIDDPCQTKSFDNNVFTVEFQEAPHEPFETIGDPTCTLVRITWARNTNRPYIVSFGCGRGDWISKQMCSNKDMVLDVTTPARWKKDHVAIRLKKELQFARPPSLVDGVP